MQHFGYFVVLRKGDKMTAVEPIRNKNLIESIEKNLKATNFRDYVLFCFGINSGLRISDKLKLEVKDVRNKKIFNHTYPAVTLRYIAIEKNEVYKSYENFIL